MIRHGMWLAAFGLFALGCAGPAGMTGPQGQTGMTGPQGPTGMTGAQGQPGMTGSQGLTGSQGQPGIAGSRVPVAPVARWTPLKDIRFDFDRAEIRPVSADRMEMGGFAAQRAKCNDAAESCSQRDGQVEVLVRPSS